MHPNPDVAETAKKYLASNERVLLVDPLNIHDLHNLMKQAYFVMTDSGGLQEEAPSLNKPVIVLREATERPEGISAGTLLLAGTDEDSIFKTATELLSDKQVYTKMSNSPNPFGDGNASERIAQAILYEYGYSDKRPNDY